MRMLLVILLAAGCGPTMSTILITDAEAKLEGAKAAEAETYAIYEYVSAQAYLDKALEEQGYADFGPAIDFAKKAQRYATEARDKAEQARQKARDPQAGDAAVIIKKRPGVEVEIVPVPVKTPGDDK